MDLPLALSVHRFVSSVGAYAGFASIVGLAILVLLFFAQARETSALRDHVDELLDRIAGLETRLARQAQAQAQAAAEAEAAAAEPVRQAAPALAAVGGSRMPAYELPPAPPAGVGAPALSAATRFVPLGVPAGAALAARASASAGGGVATAPGPAPATPAGITNGSSGPRPAPVAVPAGPGSPPVRAAAPGRAQGTPVPARTAAASSAAASRRAAARPAPPARALPRSGSPRRGRLVLIAAGVLALAAVAVGVVLSSSSNSPSSGNTTPARQTTTRAASTQVNPRTVTVAVLNGTATAGLAHRTAQRLSTDGFQEGKITTAADQTRAATTVAYIPGARAQAIAVARALKLGVASVSPVDSGTRAVACGGLPTCTASVMVTIGSDLASQ